MHRLARQNLQPGRAVRPFPLAHIAGVPVGQARLTEHRVSIEDRPRLLAVHQVARVQQPHNALVPGAADRLRHVIEGALHPVVVLVLVHRFGLLAASIHRLRGRCQVGRFTGVPPVKPPLAVALQLVTVSMLWIYYDSGRIRDVMTNRDTSKPTASLRMDEESYQHFKQQADAAGLSVQDWVQRSFDAHARKMFPNAFEGGKP